MDISYRCGISLAMFVFCLEIGPKGVKAIIQIFWIYLDFSILSGRFQFFVNFLIVQCIIFWDSLDDTKTV